MAISPHVSGARAKVSLNGVTVGIWTSIDYSVLYDVVPSFILGRYSPAAITTTGVEPVSITCSGWQIVDHSMFVNGDVTPLQDLLQQDDITLTVTDRATGANLATIIGCKPTGVSQSVSSKSLATGSNTYLGMLYSDSVFQNAEDATASTLPT